MTGRTAVDSQNRHVTVAADRRIRWQLPFGLALIAAAWTISWSETTSLAHHTFFPLWLGYILAVDGLVHVRVGTSPLARSPGRFIALFVVSIPFWWLFEVINSRLENWTYLRPHAPSFLTVHVEGSIAFSTVVPALFVTAEFYRTVPGLERAGRWRRFAPGHRGLWSISALGLAMFAASLAAPNTFFPLVWIGLFLFVDPIVKMRGGRSIAGQVAQGWWGTVWCLFLAGITCGFFWEMWNSRAMPKWVYDVAYAERFHLFEMPALGYGGYLPFALETYALVMLVNTWLHIWPGSFLAFDRVSDT